MHQSSTGELGTLNIEGRQVGGFSGWEIDVTTYPVNRGQLRASRVAKWRATAEKFWMIEKVNTDCFDAIFYCFDGVAFKQVSRNEVKVKLPAQYPIGQPVTKPLEMLHG